MISRLLVTNRRCACFMVFTLWNKTEQSNGQISVCSSKDIIIFVFISLYFPSVLSRLQLILTADEIDKASYEVKKVNDEPIDNVEELVEELPDNNARYILLSYPMKLPDGRFKSPLVLIYWRPPTCGQESKMLYAGAVEQFRDKAGVAQYV